MNNCNDFGKNGNYCEFADRCQTLRDYISFLEIKLKRKINYGVCDPRFCEEREQLIRGLPANHEIIGVN